MPSYTVKPGESWASIAGSELGDQKYLFQLMEANPDTLVLHPGATITLPAVTDTPRKITHEMMDLISPKRNPIGRNVVGLDAYRPPGGVQQYDAQGNVVQPGGYPTQWDQFMEMGRDYSGIGETPQMAQQIEQAYASMPAPQQDWAPGGAPGIGPYELMQMENYEGDKTPPTQVSASVQSTYRQSVGPIPMDERLMHKEDFLNPVPTASRSLYLGGVPQVVPDELPVWLERFAYEKVFLPLVKVGRGFEWLIQAGQDISENVTAEDVKLATHYMLHPFSEEHVNAASEARLQEKILKAEREAQRLEEDPLFPDTYEDFLERMERWQTEWDERKEKKEMVYAEEADTSVDYSGWPQVRAETVMNFMEGIYDIRGDEYFEEDALKWDSMLLEWLNLEGRLGVTPDGSFYVETEGLTPTQMHILGMMGFFGEGWTPTQPTAVEGDETVDYGYRDQDYSGYYGGGYGYGGGYSYPWYGYSGGSYDQNIYRPVVYSPGLTRWIF